MSKQQIDKVQESLFDDIIKKYKKIVDDEYFGFLARLFVADLEELRNTHIRIMKFKNSLPPVTK